MTGQAQFRLVVSSVTGPPAFGVTIGWDKPTRLWKPYLTLEVLGWMACIGWSHLLWSPEPEYERQACQRAMRRDYWAIGKGLQLVAAAKIHDPDEDDIRPFLVQNMLQDAGIKDGDEFEILVTATGRRPHGDRLYIRDLSGMFRPETDEECLRRIESKWDHQKSTEATCLQFRRG